MVSLLRQVFPVDLQHIWLYDSAMNAGADRERRIRRPVGRAIADFGLIENHDRILVALSGGKDSWTLLRILDNLRQRAPVSFSLVAVTVHPEFPGFRTDGIEAYLREHGYEHRIVHAPVHKLMLEKLSPDDIPCALCSRIKR